MEGIDVVSQAERGDVGLKAIDDGPSLFARSAMRLFDRDLLTCFRFPVGDEECVDLFVELRVGS